MWASYDFLFEDFCSSSFVYSGDFEDLCCVETVVGLALHGRYISDRHFNDSDIRVTRLRTVSLSDMERRATLYMPLTGKFAISCGGGVSVGVECADSMIAGE
jgi:hypothetical protein